MDSQISDNKSSIESIRTSELQINKNDLKCAPSITFSAGSCIDLDMLVKMARAYNKYNYNKDNLNDQIKLNDTVQVMAPNKYKKYLVKQFKKKIKGCTNQKCWVEQDFMKYMDAKLKKKAMKDTFRPYGPVATQSSVWLNTTNIDEVMAQYENVYPDFKYLATVPIDFDKLDYYPLKGIDFNKYIKAGKKKLGVVFNLDDSTQSGSHWVALFINFENGDVAFSDSYGVGPEKRITDFMRKAGYFMKDKLNMQPSIKINKTRHQRGGSACGPYSMDFILRMLKGEKFEDITAKRIPDEYVNGKRDELFIKKA